MRVHGATVAPAVPAAAHVGAAIAALALAGAAALLADRAFARRGRNIAARLAAGGLTPVIDTRLRFARRVIGATIIALGVAVALSQFDALGRLAASVLASGAIAAAIVGFAARQTLANGVAGLLLAVTQPLRIGDDVVFEGETGTVEDVRLTYTYLRTAEGSRIVIPNERLASGVLRNDTVLEPSVAARVSLALAREADATRAVEAIGAALPEATAVIAEIAADATRVDVTGPPGPPATRTEREDALRAAAYAALHRAGLR